MDTLTATEFNSHRRLVMTVGRIGPYALGLMVSVGTEMHQTWFLIVQNAMERACPATGRHLSASVLLRARARTHGLHPGISYLSLGPHQHSIVAGQRLSSPVALSNPTCPQP